MEPRALQLSRLEPRIMYSATVVAAPQDPLAVPPADSATAVEVQQAVSTPQVSASTVSAMMEAASASFPSGDTAQTPTAIDANTLHRPEAATAGPEVNEPGVESDQAAVRRELVILDSHLEEAELFLDRITNQPGQRDIDVVLLNPDRDGVEQITEILSHYSHLDAVHILSHGEDGALRLGDTWLTGDNLAGYAGSIAQWGAALAADADLLLFGCEVAASESGRHLADGIAALTGADVNASTDNTGSELFGGNWDLEYATGHIETAGVVSESVQQDWINLLNVSVDAASSGAAAKGVSSVTVAHTTSGTNRLMLVSIATDPNGTVASSVTYNGVSLTLVGTREQVGNHSRIELWALVAPTTGTHNVVVTMSGTTADGTVVGVMTFTGVDQSSPLANFTTAVGSSTAASATISSQAGDMVFGAVHSHNGTSSSPGAGQTEYFDTTANASNSSGTVSAGATSVTTLWTVRNDDWTVAAVSIRSDNYGAVISGLAGDSLRYTAGGGAIVIEQGGNASITDSDSPDFNGGTLTVSFTAGSDSTEDVLSIRNQGTSAGQIGLSGSNVTYGGTVIGTVAGGSGGANLVVTLNANANATSTAALLRNITFRDTDAATPTTGTRTVRFVLTDGDGGISANYDAAVVVGAPASTTGLWLSSVTSATSSSGVTWNDSAVVGFTGPNLSFEPGTTSGTFSTLFNFDSFALDGDAQVRGLYVVRSTVTVGSGANSVTLQAGDVLFSTVNNESFAGISGSNKDLWLFRPTTPGNYSSGTFSILLNDPAGQKIRDISLVESSITVGGVTLNAGDFLLSMDSAAYDKDISRFVATGVGTGTTSGTLSLFIDGSDIGIGQQIGALEFINQTTTIGNTTLQAGQIVLSVLADDTVGSNNLSVTKFDLFALTVTQAGSTTVATSTLFLDGSDVGMSAGGEEWNALALTGVNAAPVLSGANSLTTILEDQTANPGTPVSSLISGRVTDGNPSALTGIAVTAVDNTNGTWQWSADGGTTWNSFGSPSAATARLLIADSNTFVRFVPSADWNGTVTNGITFRAWDQTTGTAGLTANTTTNGGTTAFSSATASSSITVTAVNDAPVLAALEGAALENTENAPATAITSSLTVADVDNATLVGATIQITGNYVSGQDVLSFTNTANIAASWNATTGTLTLTGTDTLANYQAALRQVKYENTSENPSSLTRTATFSVNDGGLSSNTVTRNITVTPVNDAPVITSNGGGSTASVNVAENTTAVTTVTSSDVDGGTPSYSISGGADAARFTINSSTGVLQFAAAPDYESPTDADGNNVYIVTVQTSDGAGGTVTQTLSVTVTPVNDNAPVITSNGGGSTSSVNVAENSTAVTTVTATDADLPTQTLSYSISGGADAARFTINSSTGVLQFATAPDYESPTDADGNIVYVVTVQASDGAGGTVTQTLSVIVTPVNDNVPVITSNGGGSTASVSVAENTTAVTTVTATDADLPTQTLTYSINGGADAARFTINSSTGVLQFATAPDYESPTDADGNNVYVVTVQASDGAGGTVTQTLSVIVTPVNDNAPVITSNGGGATASVNVAENSTAVTTVTATDVDLPTQTLSYSISGGADASRFTINSSTGVLQFAAAPDYESPADTDADNVYVVTVQASDGAGGMVTQTLSVTVTPINDNAPVITSNGGGLTASVSVAENAIAVTTVTATDADLPSQTLSYSISGGADAARFTINSSTGVLQFMAAPDYESPADADGDNVYIVTVQASDGAGGTATQALSVTVTPVNDNAPVITSNSGGSTASVSVAENTTAVTTVTAIDADLPTQTLSYSIIGGADAARFTISSSMGVLEFATAPDYESPTDADGNNVYIVTVQVSDGVGETVTQTLNVTVTPVNDNAPVIISNGGGTTAGVSVAENTTAVTTAVATDADLPAQTSMWSILGGSDAALFTIDAGTGALSFTIAPDYESPADADGNNTYVVTVQVSDGAGGTATQTLSVTVNPVNDNAPVITSNGGGSIANISVAENTTAVTTVTATDADLPAQALSYSISGGADAARFTIDESTGVLEFAAGPDYESPADADGNNVYVVTIEVSDGAGGTATQTLSVTVNPVNDHAPMITSNGGGSTASVSVVENSIVVTTVTATDADLPTQTLSYSIIGGADAARFAINSSSGVLQFATAPDYESPTDADGNNIYIVTVQASDGAGGTVAQTLSVTVTPVNDNAPVITSNGGGAAASVSVAEDSTVVTTVTATDADLPSQTLSYSIFGGADASLFTIDASTGVLEFAAAPDFESPADTDGDNIYLVTVQVSDGAGGTSTQTLSVTVTPINDHAPVITSNGGGSTTSVSVAENSTAVTTVTATDADLPSQMLSYSISGGDDGLLFTIDASTGVLEFASVPDYESPADADGNNMYIVTVQVSDGAGGTSTQTLSVAVTPVNDNPPVITSNGGGAFASVSVAENTAAVTTVTATDADLPTQTLSYSISGGADAARFTIDSSTGGLQFAAAPDYESPADADGDNVYVVSVEVSDGVGGTATQTLSVTVTPVNDHAPVITSNGGGATASVSVAENSTAVTNVIATDADLPTQTLSYSISGGVDAARFTINSSTGVLQFAVAPDYESPTDADANNVYVVTVQTSDGAGGTATQTLSVTITPVNDNAPVITSNGGGSTASVNVAENSTAVTTVTATDADLPTQTLTYSIAGGADAARFIINASTGVLEFAAAPDYEIPADADGDNVYIVTVQTSDGAGGTATQTLSVTVTPVNDHAPVITSNGGGASASVGVAENATAVTTVTATDVDLPAQSLSYSISGGADASLFTIDAGTGVLTFTSAPDYESPADADGDNLYVVIVQASDGTGGMASQTISVNVTPINDNAPVITSNGGGSTAVVSVAENTTAVTTVTATDADLPTQTLSYSISGGGDAALFAIDASTGVLRFVSAPDYESPTDVDGNNVYMVTVRASDGAGGTVTQTLSVIVTPLDDNAPVISGGPTASVSVAENTTAVTTLAATDADFPVQSLTWSITGGPDAALFTVDAGTGALSFTIAPDHESPADADSDNLYIVTVQVSDGAGGTATQTLSVTVTPVNDNAPVITSNGGGSTASVSVAENSTAVTTVAATDADLPAQTLNYSISGGPDAALFTINPSTGVLEFTAAPDFESPADADGDNVYVVTVEVSDGVGGTATQTLSVTVNPVNDHAPVITSNGGGATSTVNVAENSAVVTTVTASDADQPSQTLSYSISGGDDALLFTIDASTGVLEFVAAPDYEFPADADGDNVYRVTVQVSDGVGGTSTQTLSISVTPVNDDAPVITSDGGGPTASVSVAEKTMFVTTVAATDADLPNQTLSYSISGGADAARFSIDASTGVLQFATAPDYESPADVGGDNVYVITVQVSDGVGGTTTQTLSVTVTPVNDNAPVISGGSTASVNTAENNTAITMLTATDADLPTQSLTWSISGGADATQFTIDASTGLLEFASAPDFESPADADGDNVYLVTVHVSDGAGGAATQTLSVTVTPVNDHAPVIISDGGGPTASVSVAENATPVTTITATDADLPSQTLSYSISGGADAALFTIDAGTGALSFTSGPNYESPADADGNNVYIVTVQASDGAGGTVTQTLSVAITPVSDHAPVVTSNGGGLTASVSVAENSIAVTTVMATDADLPGQTLSYSIFGGADASLFTIDASTGVLEFAAAPDFESPADSDGDNIYLVTVQVSDGAGGTAIQALSITVTPVNDNIPVIAGGSTSSASVAENTTAITTMMATDADLPDQTLTWSIAGGADAAQFTIDSSTGVVEFVSAPDHESPADADGNNIYLVTVQVSDGSGGTATQTLSVTVTPVNDHAPVITSNGGGATAGVSVAENTSAVTTVVATDADLPTQTLIYSISGGADANLFTIDASTGVLQFVTAPDYESPSDADGDNVYVVIVAVSDGAGGTAAQTLSATVTSANDHTPVITSDGGGSTASVSIAENTIAVTTVMATDADLPGQILIYSISGGADAALFTIDASTGVLQFMAAPDFESPADADANNVYVVTVQASDGSGGTITQTLIATITPVNDHAPVIAGGSTASVSVTENMTSVTTLTAIDMDLPSQTLTWSISGGADAALFSIDVITGALEFVVAPDYESPADADGNNVYVVTVQASDGAGGTTTQTLSVSITPINDHVPVITGGSTANVSVAENSIAVTTVVATDADLPVQNLTWSIVGGADAVLFAIDAVTGALAFTSIPDYEAPADADGNNTYVVTVQVSDGAAGTSIQTLSVAVTPVNDEAPFITGGAVGSVSVVEGNATVATIAATDADEPSSSLTWSIAGGADATLFTIDAVTGVLSFVSAPDYSSPIDADGNNVYVVAVQVSDGAGGTATRALNVTVTRAILDIPMFVGLDPASSAEFTTKPSGGDPTHSTAWQPASPADSQDPVIVFVEDQDGSICQNSDDFSAWRDLAGIAPVRNCDTAFKAAVSAIPLIHSVDTELTFRVDESSEDPVVSKTFSVSIPVDSDLTAQPSSENSVPPANFCDPLHRVEDEQATESHLFVGATIIAAGTLVIGYLIWVWKFGSLLRTGDEDDGGRSAFHPDVFDARGDQCRHSMRS